MKNKYTYTVVYYESNPLGSGSLSVAGKFKKEEDAFAFLMNHPRANGIWRELWDGKNLIHESYDFHKGCWE